MEETKIENRRLLNLPIPNAKVYRCTILRYRLGHGELEIQIDKGQRWRGKNSFYLTFMDVLYFEGSLIWESADFRTGSSTEFEEVLSRVHFSSEHDILSKEHRLFIVETERGPVKILSHKNVLRYREPPLDEPHSS